MIIKTVVEIVSYTFPSFFSFGYQLEFEGTSKVSAAVKETDKNQDLTDDISTVYWC